MGGALKELAEQYGLLWMLVKWGAGAVVLAIIVAFVVIALEPRPVLVAVVENRTVDSLVQGRLTINGNEADPLGMVAPGGVGQFVARVPSESDVGVKFSRNGKLDVEASAGGYFHPGDTAWIVLVAAGDSLARRLLSNHDAEAVAKSVAAPVRAMGESAEGSPRNRKQRK